MSTHESLGALLRELFRQALRRKWLVGSILVVGVLQAFLTKAPYLLLVDLAEVFAPQERPSSNVLHQVFTGCKEWLLATVGLEELIPVKRDPRDLDYQQAVLTGASLMLAVFAVAGALTIYAFRVLANLAAIRFVVDLRNRLCKKLMSLSMSFFSRQRTGELISAVSNDTNAIRHSYTLLFENAFLEPLMILFNIVFAASVHPLLGLMVLMIVPFLMLPMGRFGRNVRRGSGKSLQALGDATDAMQQMFSGYRTVKAFRLEDREIAEFEKINERFLDRTLRMVKAKAKSQGFLYLTYMLGLAVIVYCLHMIRATEAVDPRNMFFAVAAIATTYQHVKRTARTYNLLKESQGAMDRLKVYEKLKPDVRDPADAVALMRPKGEIRFERVSFAYDSEPVVRDLTFEIRPGEKIAFVGQSGAGKSTIFNLLLRFYDPDQGAVLVDGRDLRSITLESYLEHVATVDQQPFLFNSTIRENILLGRPGSSEAAMLRAAKAAVVDDFVRHLPQGYDTVVGERGSMLSGGQLQRITIARAIIRDPVILLLDEATSSLDTQSEKHVQRALDNLMRGRTCFMVAHRLSTVRGADRIFVIEDGRIVEEGSHEELMARVDSAYRRLSLMQAH